MIKQGSARDYVPFSQMHVIAPGHEMLAVSCETHSGARTAGFAVTWNIADQMAGGNVPQADGVIIRNGNQLAAIRRKGDAAQKILFMLQFEPLLAGAHVPYSEG